MTFANIYNQTRENPDLLPLDENSVEPEVIPQDIPIQEEEGNLEGISPRQSTEAQFGNPQADPNTKAIDPEVLPDLSDPKVKQQMKAEERIWWGMDKGDERNAARDKWINTYWGSEKKYNDQFSIYGTSNPVEHLDNIMQPLAAVGMGLADYGMDLVGLLPGLAGVDNAYDRYTAKMLDNPGMGTIREVSKIALPSILTGNAIQGLLGKAGAAGQLSKLQQWGLGIGLNTVTDAAIVSLSDQGEGPNYFEQMYESKFMNTFGKDQMLEIPEILRTTSSDSPWLNRFKHGLADLPISFLGNLIGYSIALKADPKGPVMGWYQPIDDQARTYKNSKILSVTDSENIKEMDRLNTLLESGQLSRADEAEAIDRLILLEEATGKLDDIDDALRIDDELIKSEENLAAGRKITENGGEVPTNLDSDITPGIKEGVRQAPSVGNVAKNQADLAAIRQGTSVGDPASVDTELAKQGVDPTNPSRGITVNISKAGTGNFNAVVDGFNFNQKQMRAAAWGYYADIVDPDSNIDDIKLLFNSNKDIKNLLRGALKIEYIPDDQFHAAMLAIRDLMDIYSGRKINETSARVMATLGFDIRTAADASFRYKGLQNVDEGLDRIIDKIEYLLDEIELSKYVAGWQLKNKDWMTSLPLENLEEAASDVLAGFSNKSISIHAKNRRFVTTLRKAKEIRPEALRALSAAFIQSEGDVDTLGKLLKYAANEVSFLTLLKSPDPKRMSLFAKSLFGVVFNNVLSAGSVSTAAIAGQTIQLSKLMTSIPGHIFWGLADGRVLDDLQRATFYYSNSNRVYKKALAYGWQQMKKTHTDPTNMIRNYRKDFVFQDHKAFEVVNDVRQLWEADGNWGRLFELNMTEGMYKFSQMQWARYPMTGMTLPDAFAKMVMAHKTARLRAFEDIIYELGYIDPQKLRKAEIKYRRSFFDKDGNLTDDFVGRQADDINFTGDDGTTRYLNEATTAFPLLRFAFMFPRTESNSVKYALSYLPPIPGANKFSKTLLARTSEQKAEALFEHGIDMATDPHAEAIFRDLRAEYTGRLIFAGGITKAAWDYAMDGGITGSGHYDPTRRKYEADTLGMQYKTLKIPGTDTRISYQGIPIIDPLFTIVGNMVYYGQNIDDAGKEDLINKVSATLVHAFGDNKLETLGFLSDLLLLEKSAIERFVKRAASATFIPAEVRQLTKAIDGTLKDYSDGILEYLGSQFIGTKGLIPTETDRLTGEDLIDHDNGWIRTINQATGIKFSSNTRKDPDRDQPITLTWGPNGETFTGTLRQLFAAVRYDGMKKLEEVGMGIKLNATQQQAVNKAAHEKKSPKHKEGSQFFWELHAVANSQKHLNDIAIILAHNASGEGSQSPDLRIDHRRSALFLALDEVVKEWDAIGEEAVDLDALVEAQKEINFELEESNVNEAINIQKRNTSKQELLQYGGSR